MAQKWSVLVVSEEDSTLQSIADTLTKHDYRVLTARGATKLCPCSSARSCTWWSPTSKCAR
jgi:hypothetical protein